MSSGILLVRTRNVKFTKWGRKEASEAECAEGRDLTFFFWVKGFRKINLGAGGAVGTEVGTGIYISCSICFALRHVL